tara:strand:+ start:410 stop:607 length:198 start_codon:yes stop_codon:yes gene_type:complete
MIKLLTNILSMFKETKQEIVDCYELLTTEQREQISDMMLGALVDHDIDLEDLEVSEMVLKLIIYK